MTFWSNIIARDLIILLFVIPLTILAQNNIQPIPKAQEAIENLDLNSTERDWLLRLDKARILCGGKREQLLLQTIYYSAQAGPNEMERALKAPMVARLLKFSKNELVAVLLPYGDASDSGIRDQVAHLIGPRLTLEDINRIIANNKTNPPLWLIENYYGYDQPELGLRAMVRIYEKQTQNTDKVLQLERQTTRLVQKARTTTLNPDQKAQVVANLRLLAGHDGWWVRLYAAAVMRQEKEFRESDVMENLAHDEHPLVRKFSSLASTE